MNKKLFFIIKILISFLLLYVVFQKVNFISILSNFKSLDSKTFLFLILLSIMNITVKFLRFKFILDSGILKKDPLPKLITSFFFSFSMSFTMPGSYGDISKYITQKGSLKNKSLAIIFEKGISIILLLFLSILTIYNFYPQYFIYYNSGILILALILLMTFKFKKNLFLYFKHHKVTMLKSASMSLSIYLLTALQYCILFKEYNYFQIFIAFISIMTLQLLPITVAGLGIRENGAAHFFGLLGVLPELAVYGALIIFVMNILIPALIGIILFFIHKSFLNQK